MMFLCFLIFHFSCISDTKPSAQLSPSASYVFEWQIGVCVPLSDLFATSLLSWHWVHLLALYRQGWILKAQSSIDALLILIIFKMSDWDIMIKMRKTQCFRSQHWNYQETFFFFWLHWSVEWVFSKNYLVALSRGLLSIFVSLVKQTN